MSASAFSVIEHEVTIDFAVKLLDYYTRKGQSVMLWGAPGIGKSEIAWQLAQRNHRTLIDFRLNIREPVDMRGIPVPDLETGTTRWLVPDELPQVERDGEFGYLFLDEINTGSTQMLAAAMQLVLDKKIGDYVLPPGWVIIGAGNRIKDKAAAQRMPTALRNRFAHITIVPSVTAWNDWATTNGIAPQLVAFMRFRGHDLLHVMPKGDENAFPTPRSWAKTSDYIDAPKELRLRLLAGLVGDAYAAELDGFIDLYESLGDLQEIVNNPKTAPLPTDSSARYAIITALARLADKKNLANIVEYSRRLNHRESETLVMHDATLLKPELRNTEAFSKWAVDHQDMTVQ